MHIEKINIGKLIPSEYNQRKELKVGDKEYEKLKRSITQFGYVEPVIWNKKTGNIIGGHQRLTVLKDLGYTEIDCVVLDIDELKEKALNIALNKIQGEWDEDKLAELLSTIDGEGFDVTFTGFDISEVDELLNSFYCKEAEEDEFDYEESEKEIKENGSITNNGDIWKLGNHKLICGNNTDEKTYINLLGKELAQLAVTSPIFPTQKEYEKDGLDNWLENHKNMIKQLSKNCGIVCMGMGDYYSTGTQYIEPVNVLTVNNFAEIGLRLIWLRIWKKQTGKGNVKSYHLVTNKPIPQYEYISAFGKETEEYNNQDFEWVGAFAGHSYKFVKRLTKDERKKWGYAGIWEMTPVKATANNIVWPVELPWRCIKMHSDKGGIILDPNGNTGTTLIACEQTDRCCRIIESNPELCDLIIKRWQEFTGEKAEKIC